MARTKGRLSQVPHGTRSKTKKECRHDRDETFWLWPTRSGRSSAGSSPTFGDHRNPGGDRCAHWRGFYRDLAVQSTEHETPLVGGAGQKIHRATGNPRGAVQPTGCWDRWASQTFSLNPGKT